MYASGSLSTGIPKSVPARWAEILPSHDPITAGKGSILALKYQQGGADVWYVCEVKEVSPGRIDTHLVNWLGESRSEWVKLTDDPWKLLPANYQEEIERWKTQDQERQEMARVRHMYRNSLNGAGSNNLRQQRWELEQVGMRARTAPESTRSGMMMNVDHALMSRPPTAIRLEQNRISLPTPPKRSRKRKTTDNTIGHNARKKRKEQNLVQNINRPRPMHQLTKCSIEGRWKLTQERMRGQTFDNAYMFVGNVDMTKHIGFLSAFRGSNCILSLKLLQLRFEGVRVGKGGPHGFYTISAVTKHDSENIWHIQIQLFQGEKFQAILHDMRTNTRYPCIGLKENYAFTDNKQNEPSGIPAKSKLAKRCNELTQLLERIKNHKHQFRKQLEMIDRARIKSPQRTSQRAPSMPIPYEKLVQHQFRTSPMVQQKNYEMLQRQREQDSLRIAATCYEPKFRNEMVQRKHPNYEMLQMQLQNEQLQRQRQQELFQKAHNEQLQRQQEQISRQKRKEHILELRQLQQEQLQRRPERTLQNQHQTTLQDPHQNITKNMQPFINRESNGGLTFETKKQPKKRKKTQPKPRKPAVPKKKPKPRAAMLRIPKKFTRADLDKR